MSRRNSPKDPLDHEPEAVTFAREAAGLTKTQLAEALQVSLSLISEIEAGTRNATPAMILKLAAALNCPRVVLQRKSEVSTEEFGETDAPEHGAEPPGGK